MSNKMTINQFRTLSGPNYWSLRPCIQMLLDIGDLEEKPTNKIKGFYKRFSEALPTIYEHRCSIGKAGGYAIQGHAAKFVRKIRGSYTNVVGLCLNSLSKILIDIGFKN